MDIDISVIVPVYNMEKRLEKCLDTLVNQTKKNIEIIIVNDGSTDGSAKIIDKYNVKYPGLIKVMHQNNQGVSVARNNGIKFSKGKYLGFVDSDDYVSEDMFEELFNTIEKEKADIVVCNYYMGQIDNMKPCFIAHDIKFPTTLVDSPKLINEIDYAPWNKLYKRQLFNDITFPVNKKYEDINAILKVFEKAKKIVFNEKQLYYYYINPNGETATKNIRNLDIYFILKDLLIYLKNHIKPLNDEFKSELEILYTSKFIYYIKSSYLLNTRKVNKFINDSFKLLDDNFPNWKINYRNKYNNSIRSKIFTNKTLFKINLLRRKLFIRGKA